MDAIQKLEYLSLVSKICTELNNHLGINDKDLAEFIINLAKKNDTFEAFKKALGDNGAEFTDSFISNLLRKIQQMKPKEASLKRMTEWKPSQKKKTRSRSRSPHRNRKSSYSNPSSPQRDIRKSHHSRSDPCLPIQEEATDIITMTADLSEQNLCAQYQLWVK
ncbi:ATP-dependent RNA helicase DHX8 [Caerostris darwini]|uniref:ATP-dependent RNA helicase DHX8 n=1 Tax=Caerostris darwini TaxID=1538125 RepID=A0AAV4MJH7_9ARAC|nr:ATP-dependent RNA helicase DHX8 [Caerostris darwini]